MSSEGQRWGFGRHLAAAVCAMVLAEDLDQVSDLAPCCWSKVAPLAGEGWDLESSRMEDFYLDLVISECAWIQSDLMLTVNLDDAWMMVGEKLLTLRLSQSVSGCPIFIHFLPMSLARGPPSASFHDIMTSWVLRLWHGAQISRIPGTAVGAIGGMCHSTAEEPGAIASALWRAASGEAPEEQGKVNQWRCWV